MQLETPFGPAFAAVNKAGAVTAFGFGHRDLPGEDCPEVRRQIEQFFARKRTAFDLPLDPPGTEFQKKVWGELTRVPFGTTASYAEIATRINRPGAARAVGRANATNPIALIVPCHRVIGSSGALTGYAYGMELKRNLLEWEGLLEPAKLIQKQKQRDPDHRIHRAQNQLSLEIE